MSYVKFSITKEVQKVFKGQKSSVPPETLIHLIGPGFLTAVERSDGEKTDLHR